MAFPNYVGIQYCVKPVLLFLEVGDTHTHTHTYTHTHIYIHTPHWVLYIDCNKLVAIGFLKLMVTFEHSSFPSSDLPLEPNMQYLLLSPFIPCGYQKVKDEFVAKSTTTGELEWSQSIHGIQFSHLPFSYEVCRGKKFFCY